MSKQAVKTKIKSLLALTEHLLAENNFMDAEIIARKVIKFDPKNPEAHYFLGEALCKQERFIDSITALGKADKLLPNHPRIQHLLGWATFMNGNAESGRKLLKLTLKKLPKDVSILCDLAVLENQQQNGQEAKQYALRALEIEPQNPMAQEVLQVTNMFHAVRLKLGKNIKN